MLRHRSGSHRVSDFLFLADLPFGRGDRRVKTVPFINQICDTQFVRQRHRDLHVTKRPVTSGTDSGWAGRSTANTHAAIQRFVGHSFWWLTKLKLSWDSSWPSVKVELKKCQQLDASRMTILYQRD